MKQPELEKSATNAVLACLEQVPFVHVENVEQEPVTRWGEPDIVVKLDTPDGDQLLVCEVKSSGQPRIAREAVNQIVRYLDALPGAYGVLVAPYISPEAGRICSEQGIGYADLAGNCRITFGQVYIEREGRPNPFAQKRDLRSLYSPRATRVVRVLLANPGKTWGVQSLAHEAQVSLGQVFNVKRLLLDREWLRTGPDGFTLAEPGALLTEWSENGTYRRKEARDYYSLMPLPDVDAELTAACRHEGARCALTGFSGAARIAPFVRYQRVTVYVEDNAEALASQLGLKQVESGANVSLWVPNDEGVFYATRELDGIPVVSDPQLYVDLRDLRGRGEDAAEFLWEEVMRPQW